MTLPLFFESELSGTDLQISNTYKLSDYNKKHIFSALRMKSTDSVYIANGNGIRYTAELVGSDSFTVTDCQPGPNQLPITLIQSLIKDGRDQQVVEMCIESGVSEIIPWQSEFAIKKSSGADAQNKLRTKWQGWSNASVEQCRRCNSVNIGTFFDGSTSLADGSVVIICDISETEKFYNFAELANVLRSENLFSDATHFYISIGPEGGLSPRDIDLLKKSAANSNSKYYFVTLGDAIYRSRTAGVVAISKLAEIIGF
ncbi:MAG: RsmE family RNA methyltransferase [Bifidobacteriaceae bacterium]|jgi:RsmE family RNA methyltransferase|nr:RsmE family RNA methyltransferase [Bifidobacteriaceae bacterium]